MIFAKKSDHLNPAWKYDNDRRERALPGLASDLTQRQKADNGLTAWVQSEKVGLIRRSPAQQTIVFERVMLSVNPKTKPGYIHLICYTLNCGF